MWMMTNSLIITYLNMQPKTFPSRTTLRDSTSKWTQMQPSAVSKKYGSLVSKPLLRRSKSLHPRCHQNDSRERCRIKTVIRDQTNKDGTMNKRRSKHHGKLLSYIQHMLCRVYRLLHNKQASKYLKRKSNNFLPRHKIKFKLT